MGASGPLRIGVAGLGRAFTLMLPTFLRDERIRLVAACDPREEARAQFARDFGAPVFDDVERLAAHPDVQAVYVASPHQFHAAQTRIAAAHGKHVLVEKPMALSMDECDAMIDACDRAGVHLIVGHCHSFDTPYLQAREIIERGDLGRVRMIQALNYTDFLYRPRRPEELRTEDGGGVVFSQAAHQVDVVRLLAGSRATRVRAVLGRWDPSRPTEGAYTAMLWFDDGAFASLTYSGYGHFDSDEWCGWIGEMGASKNPDDHGQARRRLGQVQSADEEARLKARGTYGGPAYRPPTVAAPNPAHQHFGPLVVSCERGDVRPLPDAVWVYGDAERRREPLPAPAVPRFEVIDELVAAVQQGRPPIHDGPWARATLEVCLAMLESAREGRDVELVRQVSLRK
ncbi:Gfo/Idh/MocA family oxidoreductase [Caldimonas tepidiphila]|uniref:Gfo/Idh/MocA family oxidoreductase n=1 Tax=Caldimonas tepidiphila TaxID=2315841 RepID=UPI000E5A76E1|nr:Gfo/Idh/MocA family oxidoreductase [Caldimonas tepidiphila]